MNVNKWSKCRPLLFVMVRWAKRIFFVSCQEQFKCFFFENNKGCRAFKSSLYIYTCLNSKWNPNCYLSFFSFFLLSSRCLASKRHRIIKTHNPNIITYKHLRDVFLISMSRMKDVLKTVIERRVASLGKH